MIKNLSYKFVSFLAEKKIIKDEFEIYQYGFELILSYSIGVFIIVIISLFTNTLYSTLIYLISFYILRKYTGGYHCKTYLSCNLSFICIFLIYIYFESYCIINWELHLMFIISLIIIWLLAPCDHENKILSKKEIEKYGGISKVLLIIYSFIMIFLYQIKPELILSMELTLIIIAILLIMGKIERRVEKHV